MSGNVTPLIRRKRESHLDDPREAGRNCDAAPQELRDPRDGSNPDIEEKENSPGGEGFQIIDPGGSASGTPCQLRAWRRGKTD